MKILVIGGGGREHALAWKVAQSPRVEQVFVAPGNAGTQREAGVINVAIAATAIDALRDFARDEAIGLTLVGPEAPLVAGVVDRFAEAGLRCFGPSAAAARLEGSKVFAKNFMHRHGIPTAAYESFSDADAAKAYADRQGAPLVIKADGLAAGKGVVVARDIGQARAAIERLLGSNAVGGATRRVVVEECVTGEEASYIVMSDGRHVLPLASSQDHKARDDGDRGPNTGGMGAYSPAPAITPAIEALILDKVIAPCIRGMSAAGTKYRGFLYAGLMITPRGEPRVLEFNCRLGDPETQPLMLRLRSDLVTLCEAACEGRLAAVKAQWDRRAALGVVLSAGGYPGNYRKGDVISGLPDRASLDAKLFHAATAEDDGRVVTAGGRVLCATALGDTVLDAQRRAYTLAEKIHWPDAYYRHDIGNKAINQT